MKILALDIETSPHLVHTWGLYNQNIGLNQVVETTRILCVAAKWVGERRVHFYAEWQAGGHQGMLEAIHRLLDEADVVMHWNGRSFDIPHLQREFLLAGMTPPEPFADIDLMLAVRKRFRFASNKLDHVAHELLGTGKVSTGGFELWLQVMAGNEVAQKRMEKYNKRDVTLLEDLYVPLRPWIPSHPSLPLRDGGCDSCCPVCGSDDVQRRGFAYTAVSKFQQYRCSDCGKWFRGAKRVGKVSTAQMPAA